jgi:hypothetical protein
VVEISVALLSLMQELQLHRGLSCALLDDLASFDGELDAAGNKLQRSLKAFEEQFSAREVVFRDEHWRNLVNRWNSLHSNWRELDFHLNLSVHSELVLGVVDVLRRFAENDTSHLQPVCVEIISEWPQMVEHLGMLRAIGLHRFGHPSGQLDPSTAALLRVHLHEARSVVASVEDGFDAPELLAASCHGITLAARLRDGVPDDTDAEGYYELVTSVIDGWYAHIRRRLFAELEHGFGEAAVSHVRKPARATSSERRSETG